MTIFGGKILKFFVADQDPESGVRCLFDPGSGKEKSGSEIKKHPGSATLLHTVLRKNYYCT
jgi:hypothetical protein